MSPDTPGFLALAAVVAVLAGAVASVSGFGIGSLLTPVLAVRVGTKLAVAAVSVPHLAATALRLWMMRQHVDRRLLLSFVLMSAAGGLAGALLQSYAHSPALTVVFGGLLVFTGVTGLTDPSERMRFTPTVGQVLRPHLSPARSPRSRASLRLLPKLTLP
jgi:uncharacterized membrane protein YfcA